MPIVAIAVGFIGSAVGTAIGAAIGGSIMGVAAATIGGVIGAGIAGGALAAMTGGSFGKGFLMGAIGSAAGAFLKGGLGATTELGGATQFADGTTTAGMLAEQGGAAFAPNALEGIGGEAFGSVGVGDITPTVAEGVTTFGDTGFDPVEGTVLGEANPQSSFMDNFPGDNRPSDFTSEAYQGVGGEQNMLGVSQTLDSSKMDWGFQNAPSGQNQFAMMPDSYSNTPLVSEGMDYAPSLENVGSSTPAPTPSVSSNNPLPSATPAVQTSTPSWGQKVGGMMKTSDAWLKNNMGTTVSNPTAKLAMGGLDSLMKMYQTHKLEREVNKQAPLSFEQFSQQYANPDDYRHAANRMAQGGHTGALPVLLARMKQQARGKYADYLPTAQQQYLQNKTNISQGYTGALQNLFTPLYAGAK